MTKTMMMTKKRRRQRKKLMMAIPSDLRLRRDVFLGLVALHLETWDWRQK